MKRIIMGIMLTAVTALGIGTPASEAAKATGDSYGYCSVSVGSSTELKQVISSVFRVKDGTYHVGVENSFRDYVSANFTESVNTPNCYTTITDYQEAADKRNQEIGSKRRDGWQVATVNWAYHGD